MTRTKMNLPKLHKTVRYGRLRKFHVNFKTSQTAGGATVYMVPSSRFAGWVVFSDAPRDEFPDEFIMTADRLREFLCNMSVLPGANGFDLLPLFGRRVETEDYKNTVTGEEFTLASLPSHMPLALTTIPAGIEARSYRQAFEQYLTFMTARYCRYLDALYFSFCGKRRLVSQQMRNSRRIIEEIEVMARRQPKPVCSLLPPVARTGMTDLWWEKFRQTHIEIYRECEAHKFRQTANEQG